MTNNIRIIPLTVGGAGNQEDMLSVIEKERTDTVSTAYIFHYNKYSVKEVKLPTRHGN